MKAEECIGKYIIIKLAKIRRLVWTTYKMTIMAHIRNSDTKKTVWISDMSHH